MDWIDTKTIYVLMHLFGVTLGAGGSFMSDVLFVTTTKDKVLDKSELEILKKGSLVVWAGLLVLIISGALLFSLDPETYLNSSKFILKMIIVGIITVNGAVFHFVHTPRLEKLVDKHLATDPDFEKYSRGMYWSGAVSIVSWVCALVLGGLRMIPVSVGVGLILYALAVTVAIVGAEHQRRSFFKK